ncbi:hypothetical protein ACN23B_14370 [Anabaena sp. FACHB-709]|uniref:Uncharacterized protein n=2 Tax=Nostocaceae TaxID=1162 RepID=A0A1Z4KHP1_ANAVA|nr:MULTISPECIES: hypothetical protein [Nostocaceae]BAY68495.1 hypothetical protein NIES23_12810 [Trichormus variabilis NIES-23]HBW30543.1 hypothetical protein [Nostoc sp. UBA8866]MBD2171697.1 hypothetical protein [Anabaena cylindrica FACHB-318]MBD2264216.1 hypothetical protein [Anabaena sp. FACHB-709]MBD2273559.1 hypothetical protein [Nostoc sp. PCC 7120 = FACHB-418]
MKSSVYRNAVVTACALGLLGLLVGCWGMTVSIEATNPDIPSSMSTDIQEIKNNPVLPGNSTEVVNKTNSPTNLITQKSKPTNSVLAARQSLPSDTKYLGKLRMSNQTDQPVRLALLARQSSNKGSITKESGVPAHWDFDPQEGSERGLILSLPNGSMKLEKGDILVAFAQDGSRRYWGPYVVGETPQPSWNPQSQEWVLVLSQ